MSKCLGCYEPLYETVDDEENYHATCSRRLFGTSKPPYVDFGRDDIQALAEKQISRHLGITGVQPKITLHLIKDPVHDFHRLTLVGLWGGFILKPPTVRFPDMPVIEDLTMHLAAAAGITTARHGLIRLKSGEFAYITKRFDREKHARKIATEDFCQLSGLLTERKYKTSMEKAGKVILRFSSRPGLDVLTFVDITLFSFLTGNSDMHLKNFSLICAGGPDGKSGEYVLSPAYDLLATRLMPIKDLEEMALTVNAKKSKLKRSDFEAMARALQVGERALHNSFARLEKAVPEMKALVKKSFLSTGMQKSYLQLIKERALRLGFRKI